MAINDVIFYVKNRKRNLVAAHYVKYKGRPIVDSNSYAKYNSLNHDEYNTLYDKNGKKLPDEDQNINGYLISPLDYDTERSVDLGKFIGKNIDESDLNEIFSAQEQFAVFAEGKSQDLQRTYNDVNEKRVDNGSFVPAFTHAASFHLGLTAEAAGLPEYAPLIGGGLYNIKTHAFRFLDNAIHLKQPFGYPDIFGRLGNTKVNGESIHDGFEFGKHNFPYRKSDKTSVSVHIDSPRGRYQNSPSTKTKNNDDRTEINLPLFDQYGFDHNRFWTTELVGNNWIDLVNNFTALHRISAAPIDTGRQERRGPIPVIVTNGRNLTDSVGSHP